MVKNETVSPPGGTNAQVQINAAIDRVSQAGGGVVTLAAGTYVISQSIKLKSNVILEGIAPAGKSIIKLVDKAIDISGDFYCTRANAKKSLVSSHDLKLTYYAPITSCLIRGIGVSNVEVRYLHINTNNLGQYENGKQLIGRGRGFFVGMQFDNGGSNIYIHDVYFNGGGQFGFGDCINITSDKITGYITICNNWMERDGHDNIYIKRVKAAVKIYNNTIFIHTNSAIRCESCTAEIYNNTCIGNVLCNPGMQLDGNGDYHVHDNYIEGSEGPGIQITGAMKKVEIDHNIIYNCGLNGYSAFTSGIHCGTFQNINIHNNTIHACNGAGILAKAYSGTPESGTIFITNNQITGTKAATKSDKTFTGYGIHKVANAKAYFNATYNNFNGNVAGNINSGSLDSTNSTKDPQYVIPGKDFHLKSKFGSWHDAENKWVQDNSTSECIRFDGTLKGSECGRYNGTGQQSKQNAGTVVPKPFASFDTEIISKTLPVKIKFTNKSTNADTILWDFGDGTTNTTQNVIEHTYTKAGKYIAKLTAYNSQGSSTASVDVNINDQGGDSGSDNDTDSGGEGNNSGWNFTRGNVFHVGPGQKYNGTDRATIQRAINDAKSGDTIWLHAATYTMSNPILLKSGLLVRGDGPSTIIYGPADACNSENNNVTTAGQAGCGYFYMQNVSNVEICGIKFTSAATSDPDTRGRGDKRYCIYSRNSSNIKVHDLTSGEWLFCDNWKASGCDKCYLYDCDMTTGHAAFYLYGSKNCRMYNCKIKVYTNAGVRIDGATNCELDHNTIFCGAGGQTAFELQGTVTGLNIHHNIVYDFAKATSSRSVVQNLSSSGSVTFANNVYWNSPGGVEKGTGTGNVANPSDKTVSNWVSKGYGYGVLKSGGGSGAYTGPIASFKYSPTWGTETVNVTFTDQSTGTIEKYEWDFGDGATSTAKNPTHLYTNPGTYTVYLKVSAGTKWSRAKGTITVKAASGSVPLADFEATPVSGTAPLEVKFTDKSQYSPTSWKWDFGDNISTAIQNPSHTYSMPGTYNVKLTASNESGSNTKIKSAYIQVKEFDPFAGSKLDARMREGSPDESFGDKPYFEVGGNSSGKFRSLLWFPLDSYKNKTIERAVLQLFWYHPESVRDNDTVIEVYRPTCVWDPAKVSWNSSTSTSKWKSPGGDWRDKYGQDNGSIPFGTLTFPKDVLADKKYYEIDVTDLVKSYISGEFKNYGFLLKSQDEVSNYIAFYSSECGTAEAVPKLVITEKVESVAKQIIYIGPAGTEGISYTCDGKDDHIQLNQALKLVSENQSKYSGVYLKGPFTYEIGDTIYIGSNTTLEGDDTAIVKLKNNCGWDANKPLIKELSTGISSVSFKGFTIDGNRENQTAIVSGKNYHNLIFLTGAKNIIIQDMNLTNNHNDGVKLINCSNITFVNNEIFLPGHDAIYCGSSSNIEAFGNKITCRINAGIRIYNGNHIKIYDNEFTSQGSGTAGIEIIKEGTILMNDVIINNNTFSGLVTAGINIYTSSSYNSNTAYMYIHHNKFWNCGLKQVNACGAIVLNGVNSLIENNTIDGCYIAGISFKNIESAVPVITGALTSTIRSNIITGIIGSAIIKDATASPVTVSSKNNCLFGNTTNYSGVDAPTGNYADIVADPLYINQSNHDYHLKSKAGRWDTTLGKWVVDSAKSPAIDAGWYDFPIDDIQEPEPHGNRINCGAYGNTEFASMSGDIPISVNNPPVIGELSNKIIEIGQTLQFTVPATDVDDDVLIYSTADTLPEGATLNSSTGAFSWTPSIGQHGTYPITFVVSDGIVEVSKTITIGVVKEEIFTYISGKIYCNRMKSITPDTVLSGKAYLDLGGLSGSGIYRTLIYTDLVAFAGKTVTSAEIKLFWYHPAGQERINDTVIEVYRPVAWDFVYANWNKRVNDTAWVNPGGDWYDANGALNGSVPFATITIPKGVVPDNIYHAIDITNLVQAYANDTFPNTGFLLKAKDEEDNYVAFYSPDLGVDEQKLKLSIQYTN